MTIIASHDWHLGEPGPQAPYRERHRSLVGVLGRRRQEPRAAPQHTQVVLQDRQDESRAGTYRHGGIASVIKLFKNNQNESGRWWATMGRSSASGSTTARYATTVIASYAQFEMDMSHGNTGWQNNLVAKLE